MSFVSDFVKDRIIAYFRSYVHDNWDAIMAKGLEYFDQLLDALEAKLQGRDLFKGTDDPDFAEFCSGLDEAAQE